MLLHVGGRGALSDSGANQGEGICAGGAAGEKRVCQSRTPRVEGCIKIHSGGFGGGRDGGGASVAEAAAA